MKQQGRVKLWLLLAAGSGDLIHSKHLDHLGPRTLTQGFLFQIFSLLNSGYKSDSCSCSKTPFQDVNRKQVNKCLVVRYFWWRKTKTKQELVYHNTSFYLYSI